MLLRTTTILSVGSPPYRCQVFPLSPAHGAQMFLSLPFPTAPQSPGLT